MNTKQILLLGVAAGAMSGCCPDNGAADGVAHFTAADRDTTVRLEDDFSQASNGGWIASHPIPGDRRAMALSTFSMRRASTIFMRLSMRL